MKRVLVCILSIFLLMGLAGTALAANTVELSTATSGVSTVYWGPVYANPTTGGASAFILTGAPFTNAAKYDAGTSLYAISNTLTQNNGTEMLAQALNFFSGATPIGPPQLVSGTSTTVIVYVMGPLTGRVGSGPHSGGTLYAINGSTGAIYWTRAVPITGYVAGALEPLGLFNATNTGATPICLAPVTIDTESYTSTKGGATIFGVSSGASFFSAGALGNLADSGVSIWAINANSGNYATTPNGNSNVTAFPFNESTGVSVVNSAPVISGDSLFVIGYSFAGNGSTIYQFVKNNLLAGVSASATMNLYADGSDQWIPTPAVSGGSLFVVDNDGGVSVYRADNLNLLYTVDYSGTETVSGVTAGPVTNGTYIVLCSTSSVSCYNVNKLSLNDAEWTYNFGPSARYSIWATPVISNGYVWVAVNDLTLNKSYVYRFKLASTDGDVQLVDTLNDIVYGSPAFVGSTNLWVATYDPQVKKVSTSGGAGYSYWPQFKFNAAKTGTNTAPSAAVAAEEEDTCFISTLK